MHDLAKLNQINDQFVYRATNREFKLALMREFGTCYWCDIPVIDFITEHVRVPDNTATIDHTISRYHRRLGERVLKVLACYKCNQERATAEDRRYGPRVEGRVYD